MERSGSQQINIWTECYFQTRKESYDISQRTNEDTKRTTRSSRTDNNSNWNHISGQQDNKEKRREIAARNKKQPKNK